MLSSFVPTALRRTAAFPSVVGRFSSSRLTSLLTRRSEHLLCSASASTHHDAAMNTTAILTPAPPPHAETCSLASAALPSLRSIGTPLSSLSASLTTVVEGLLVSILESPSIVLIKRTYQPSILRKRRKHGFLQRHKSVGGRRVLKRRTHKGRARLGGC